jgi:hypothetical protein
MPGESIRRLTGVGQPSLDQHNSPSAATDNASVAEPARVTSYDSVAPEGSEESMFWPLCGAAATTIAKMPALIASGSADQAAMIIVKSEMTAERGAALVEILPFSSDETASNDTFPVSPPKGRLRRAFVTDGRAANE